MTRSAAQHPTADAPRISAVVCTYNRCDSLRDTLRSLNQQALGDGVLLDIVVVDNRSTDRTKDVVQQFAMETRWPLCYVAEPRQGIAFARNAGLRAAQGTYVAFIDDDAVAGPGWAAAIVRAFTDTGADMVGGIIEPWWLTPRPQWLVDDLMGPITAFGLGSQRRRCTRSSEAFLTTNCALRASSVGRYGLFDVSLGRRGGRWVGGEDFELFKRWLAQGAYLLYEPAAVVRHKVSAERVSPEFYRRWFEDIGYTQGHQLDWKWHYRLSVVPVWRWGKFVAAGAQYGWTRIVPSDDASRLRAELWWRFQRSFLRERLDHWKPIRRSRASTPCRFSQA